MAEHQIRFDDGAAYERMMGAWSKLAGGIFLDWVAPRPGLRWVDVGCGNGAFTELVVERCAPAEVRGIETGTVSQAACGAKTRSGAPCKSAPVTGRRRCRMHGGADGSGAPTGGRHGNYKHGRYTAEMSATRRWLREVTQMLRELSQRQERT